MFGLSLCSHSGEQSAAMKKLERFSVQKVTGDGRCLFRALVSTIFNAFVIDFFSPFQFCSRMRVLIGYIVPFLSIFIFCFNVFNLSKSYRTALILGLDFFTSFWSILIDL